MAESDYGENINNKADFKVGVDDVIFSVYTNETKKPFIKYQSLPGTLVIKGESLEAEAYRVLVEKSMVKNLYLEQLYTFVNPDREIRRIYL